MCGTAAGSTWETHYSNITDHSLRLSLICLHCLTLQITAVGARHGAWGLHTYGAAPKRMDALHYYPPLLSHELEEAQEAEAEARQHPLPAAFVTLK